MANETKESAAAPPAPPPDRIELGEAFQARMAAPFQKAREAEEEARLARAELNVETLRILREVKLSADEWNIAFDPADQRFRAYRLAALRREG